MPGFTLARYLAGRFVAAIGGVFLVGVALIYLVDLIELLRRAGDADRASLGALVVLAAQRTPALTEQALPFAVLFGAMIAFVVLSRRLELVVARGSGVSVWQFLAPPLGVALAIGLVATVAYNPIAADLKTRAERTETEFLRGRRAADEGRWIRQRSVDGQAILHAAGASDEGRRLVGLTVFTFAPTGAFEERIEADEAVLGDRHWELRGARVLGVGRETESHDIYLLATNLTPAQVRERFASPAAVGFWRLPEMIELAARAGLPTTKLELRRHLLIAQPALLATMVLIAATVSLRLARLGSVAPAILGGVCAAFVLYVFTKLAEDLGAVGFVEPAVAAWTPALVGSLMSVTVLLHQEDG